MTLERHLNALEAAERSLDYADQRWAAKRRKDLERLADWLEFESKVEKLVKHASPIHPGTGTDQSVHGGGATGIRSFDKSGYNKGWLKGFEREALIDDIPVTIRSYTNPFALGASDRAEDELVMAEDYVRDAFESVPDELWNAAGNPKIVVVANTTRGRLAHMLSATRNEPLFGEGLYVSTKDDLADAYKGFEYEPDGDHTLYLSLDPQLGELTGEVERIVPKDRLRHNLIHELSHAVTMPKLFSKTGQEWFAKTKRFRSRVLDGVPFSVFSFETEDVHHPWFYSRVKPQSHEFLADAMAYRIQGHDDIIAEAEEKAPGLTEFIDSFFENGEVPIMKGKRIPVTVACGSADLYDPAARLVKHYGPGPHPGTGTSQQVHGGGGGTSVDLESLRANSHEWGRNNLWLNDPNLGFNEILDEQFGPGKRWPYSLWATHGDRMSVLVYPPDKQFGDSPRHIKIFEPRVETDQFGNDMDLEMDLYFQDGNWTGRAKLLNDEGATESTSYTYDIEEDLPGEHAMDVLQMAGFHPDALPSEGPMTTDFEPFRRTWPGSYSSSVRADTEQGLRDVFAKMQEDPRWEQARSEWAQMGDAIDSGVLDVYYEEAQALNTKFNDVATEVLGEEWYNGYDSHEIGPWYLNERLKDIVVLEEEEGGVWTTYDIDYVSDPEDLEELIETGEPVFTAAAEKLPFKYRGTEAGFHDLGDQFRIVDIEGEMVRLRPQGTPLGRLFEGVEGVDPRFVGDANFGPAESDVFAHYTTLYGEDIASDFDLPFRVMEEDEFNDIEFEVRSLEDDWNDFMAQFPGISNSYGANPDTVISMLDVGDLGSLGVEGTSSTIEHLVVNDSFNGTGTSYGDGTRPEEVPRLLRDLWSNTSADDHMWAHAVQRAVAEEFGVSASVMRHHYGHTSAWLDSKAIVNKYGTMLKVWARSVHETTQEHLTELGWDEVPVARGMKISGGSMSDLVSLPKNVWTPIEGDLNPISSFSVATTTAAGFAGGTHPTLLRGWVPKEQVWGISFVGNGSIREKEVIVLGGDAAFDGEAWVGASKKGSGTLKDQFYKRERVRSIDGPLLEDWLKRHPPSWFPVVDPGTTYSKTLRLVAKHASPIHPGTGTDQSVHGGGRTATKERPDYQEAAGEVTFSWSGAVAVTTTSKQGFEEIARTAIGRFRTLYPDSALGPVHVEVISEPEMAYRDDAGTAAMVDIMNNPNTIVVNDGLINGYGFKSVIDEHYVPRNRTSLAVEVYKRTGDWGDFIEATLYHEVTHSASAMTSPVSNNDETMPRFSHHWYEEWGDEGVDGLNYQTDHRIPSRYAATNAEEYFSEGLTDVAYFGDDAREHSKVIDRVYRNYLEELF